MSASSRSKVRTWPFQPAVYMSPEQARGLALDKRTDIWAFGCVLYEMLSGQRAFESDGISDTLACVLTKEPSWTDLPSNTPVPVRRLLHRALVKDRKARLADMQDARIEIDEALRIPTEDRRRDDRFVLLSLKTALGAVVLVRSVCLARSWDLARSNPLSPPRLPRVSVCCCRPRSRSRHRAKLPSHLTARRWSSSVRAQASSVSTRDASMNQSLDRLQGAKMPQRRFSRRMGNGLRSWPSGR